MKKIFKLFTILSFSFLIGLTLYGCSTEPGEGRHFYYEYKLNSKSINPNEIAKVGKVHFNKNKEEIVQNLSIFKSVSYGVGQENEYKYTPKNRLILDKNPNDFNNVSKIGISFRDQDKYSAPLVENGIKKITFDLWLSNNWKLFDFERYQGELDSNGKPFLNWCIYIRQLWNFSDTDINNLILYKQNFKLNFNEKQATNGGDGFLMHITIDTGTDEYIIPSVPVEEREKLFDLVLEIRPFEYTNPYIKDDYRNDDKLLVPIPLERNEDETDLAKLNQNKNYNPYKAIKEYGKLITNLKLYFN